MDDQANQLEDALQVVKVQAYQMKRCLDKSKLMDAFKHATTMLAELKANQLSPKSYYELYMAVSSELAHLEMYLQDEHRSAETMRELYELVQYATSIVPRLYLLITVGAVYIRTCEEMTKEILKDLVEMCRGVQHPLRGLFLRNYLLQTTKNLLPDSEEAPGEGQGDNRDSISYILDNFAEMNKLWVRMQHQVVFPGILEQVVSCRDPIAQEYLMECICQVFPDEFHIKTLNAFLDGCAVLHSKVNVRNVVNSMIERLAAYTTREDSHILADIQLFDVFSAHITSVIDARTDMAMEDIVALMASLTNLALRCFPEHKDYVNTTMDYCRRVLAHRQITCVDEEEATAAGSQELSKLARTPIDSYDTVATVLGLQDYPALLMLFGYENRKALAIYLVEKVLEKREAIDTVANAMTLLDLISPLVEDQEDQPEGLEENEEFEREQELVARLIHYFTSTNPQVQYEILRAVKKRLGFGAEKRLKYTIPPLVNCMLKLTCYCHSQHNEDSDWKNMANDLLRTSHKLLSILADAGYAELALRLFVHCSAVSDRLGIEDMADECMIRALLAYEDKISGAKAQAVAIALLVGTLEGTTMFNQENFNKLAQQCAVHSSQLLTKPGQTRAVCMSSHPFWSGRTVDGEGQVRNGKKVLECLQKALKIACSCVDSTMKVSLMAEILDQLVYFYERGNDCITINFLKDYVDLIQTNMANADSTEDHREASKHLQNIIEYIKRRQAAPTEEAVSFEGLVL